MSPAPDPPTPPALIPPAPRRARWATLAIGLAATLWCLTRVIQKPSRASYPCVRAGFPVMSAFVGYLLALVGAAASFRLLRREGLLPRPRSLAGAAFVCALVWMVGVTPQCGEDGEQCTPNVAEGVLGAGQGLFPGRVVWIHDRAATNEGATNAPGDGYFLAQNNSQPVIDQMLVDGLTRLTDTKNAEDACRKLFEDFNESHDRGRRGYRSGEKIFVKINATSSWGYGDPWGNIQTDFDISENGYYGVAETLPAAVLALLRTLVRECSVAEQDLIVGDPMKDLYTHAFDYWFAEFPRVTYLSAHGGRGRTQATPAARPQVFYSDRGRVLREGDWSNPDSGPAVTADTLYSVFEDATYIVNLGALKGHNRGGVTLCAKNHFGSNTWGSALHLHMGLPNPAGQDAAWNRPDRQGYGLYRVLVDLMGHRLTGGKTLLYLVDGLWGGTEAVDPPVKFSSAPFGNDWSSSFLLSQDPVAIESVGFDILKNEMTEARHPGKAFPQMEGVDDYLHQAAGPGQWPAGIVYDPENDGTPLVSLGVHEHWVGPDDRRYSRNLGLCQGIELVYVGR